MRCGLWAVGLAVAPLFWGLAQAEAAWPTGSVLSPSGQTVELEGLLYEEHPYSGEMQVIVRLLAPAIAQGQLEMSQVREDMDWACATWGQPAAEQLSSAPDWVIVEMMAAPVPRGVPAPSPRRGLNCSM